MGTVWWLTFVGLVSVLLCAPFLRTVYWMGDEGVLLDGAARMLHGDRLYVDLFEMLPPGGFVLTALWFSIAGMTIFSARILAMLTIVGIACFTYLACQRASKSAPLSACITLGWAVMSQARFMQLGHHWFTTLFSMLAAWAVLASAGASRRQLGWPLTAGLAAGAAALMVPTCGALAVLAGVTAFWNVRQQRAALITYVLGCAVVPVGILFYLSANHESIAAFDDVIRFTAERYSSIQAVPFGEWAQVMEYPLIAVFPAAGLLIFIVSAWKWRTCRRDRVLHVCAAFSLAGFAGCFPRPDSTHIAFTAPLACPLLAYCAAWIGQRVHPLYRVLAASAVISLCLPSAAAFSLFWWHALQAEAALTPRGGVVFTTQPWAPELLARIAAAPPEDRFFFYPFMPMLPFLAAREQVSKIDMFEPELILPSQYQDTCIAVMQQASWVVIDLKWTNPYFLKTVFPAMRDPRPPETQRFEQALYNGFAPVARYGTIEMWHRRQGADQSLCAGIAE